MEIAVVWIEEGCCGCGACPTTVPEIFNLPDGDTAVVRGQVRMDGVDGTNERERSPLAASFGIAESEAIIEAADGCPVEVIRFTTVAANAERSA